MSTDDRMETITDPALIRATDDPDERGDFPCCADRAHKESLGGDSESGTYNRSNRPPAGPCTDERTTPAPVSGAGLPLYHDTKHERDQAEARAESAEAEVVTLRAKVARRTDSHTQLVRENEPLRAKVAEGRRIVGMLAEAVESECEDDPEMCHEHDRTDDGRCPLLVDLNRAHAALAVTTGEGQ